MTSTSLWSFIGLYLAVFFVSLVLEWAAHIPVLQLWLHYCSQEEKDRIFKHHWAHGEGLKLSVKGDGADSEPPHDKVWEGINILEG